MALQHQASETVLHKPLRSFTKVSDKGRPMALMDVPIRQLISRTFDELLSIPGVGRGKAEFVAMCFRRALRESERHSEPRVSPLSGGAPDLPLDGRLFDDISGELWDVARREVQEHGFESEVLGRYVPRLDDVPSTLWDVRLSEFCALSLDELRSRPGFGRVKTTAVLTAFWGIHRVVCDSRCPGHLAVNLRPQFALTVERWVRAVLKEEVVPTPEQTERRFLVPVLQQLEHDAGDAIARIARHRLGLGVDRPLTLAEIAKDVACSVERVRQQLVRIAVVLKVRWPEGQYLLDDLSEALEHKGGDEYVQALVDVAFQLFYPVRKYTRISSLRRAAVSHVGEEPTRDDIESESKSNQEPRRKLGKESAQEGGGDDAFIHHAILDLLKGG